MSRTKRSYPTQIFECRRLGLCKHFDNWSDGYDWLEENGIDWSWRSTEPKYHVWDVYHPRMGRDRKPWDKPIKAFKKIMRGREKAKVKQAIRNGRWDMIPEFKKDDQWNWT